MGFASNGYHTVFPSVTELSGLLKLVHLDTFINSPSEESFQMSAQNQDHLSLQKLESVLTEVSWLMFMLDSGLEIVVDIEVLDLDLELDRESEGEVSGSGPWSEK